MDKIRKQCPAVKVLVLSMHDNEEYIRQVLTAGAIVKCKIGD